jgi:hypothetical protein
MRAARAVKPSATLRRTKPLLKLMKMTWMRTDTATTRIVEAVEDVPSSEDPTLAVITIDHAGLGGQLTIQRSIHMRNGSECTAMARSDQMFMASMITEAREVPQGFNKYTQKGRNGRVADLPRVCRLGHILPCRRTTLSTTSTTIITKGRVYEH